MRIELLDKHRGGFTRQTQQEWRVLDLETQVHGKTNHLESKKSEPGSRIRYMLPIYRGHLEIPRSSL